MRGPGGGNSQSSFCGGNSCVVEYMSIKFAIPKRPANDGSKRLAFGIPTGLVAGNENTAKP